MFVEGVLNPFWVWNALPIGLAAVFLALSRRRGWSEIPARAFGVGAVGVSVYAHMAWLWVDWDQIATGSSTAGILFIVLPIIAVGCGVVLFVLSGLGLLLRRKLAGAGARE